MNKKRDAERRVKHSLIVFVADLKRFLDDDQRVGELALILAVENGCGDLRSQIPRLERPVLCY